jgi:hypothetical protein
MVSCTTHAGEWASSPIAFIHNDFTFYDDKSVQLSQADVTQDLPRGVTQFVFIWFLFDKSPIRGTFLCPMKAAISLLRCANMLGIPDEFPIGTFCMPSQQPGEFTFIKGDNVKHIMQ